MHLGSFLLGLSVIGIALLMQRWNPLPSLRDPSGASELDRQYAWERHRGRSRIHALLGTIGLVAVAAGLVGQGRVWIVLWGLIGLLLATVIVLALRDYFRTRGYYRAKLPEIRRRTLGETSPRAEP